MNCKNRLYFKLDYPDQEQGGKTLLTGIRGQGDRDIIDDLLYITGFYKSPEGIITSFVFNGDISDSSKLDQGDYWFKFNYPSEPDRTVISTSLYGPSIIKNNNIRVVGSYSIEEEPSRIFGCYYTGNIDGSGMWRTLEYPFLNANVIAHSSMKDLIVGNYLVKELIWNAFIYDIKEDKYYEIKPKYSWNNITSYGIWYNGCNDYTICGGFVEDKLSGGYIVNWNNNKKSFNNWRKYYYPNASITHFDGISSDGKSGYNLTGDAVINNEKLSFILKLRGCRIKWCKLYSADKNIISGNSIYKSTAIGIYNTDIDKNTVHGYLNLQHRN